MAGRNHDTENEAIVTLVVTRVLAKGAEDAFRNWSARVDRSAALAGDHRGSERIEQTGGLFHSFQRFASSGALASWQQSEEYSRLMREGDRFSTPRVQEVTGNSTVIRLPSDGDGPKWKLFLMSWVGVLPLVLLFNGSVQLLPQQPPWYLRALFQSCFLVALMTWLVRPMVSRRLKPWAMRDSDGDARVSRDD
jgi:antibiotic biosynthesis monooxygenase (ABM) superfamily enzyme